MSVFYPSLSFCIYSSFLACTSLITLSCSYLMVSRSYFVKSCSCFVFSNSYLAILIYNLEVESSSLNLLLESAISWNSVSLLSILFEEILLFIGVELSKSVVTSSTLTYLFYKFICSSYMGIFFRLFCSLDS